MSWERKIVITHRGKLGVSEADISHIIANVPHKKNEGLTQVDGGYASFTYGGLETNSIDGGTSSD